MSAVVMMLQARGLQGEKLRLGHIDRRALCRDSGWPAEKERGISAHSGEPLGALHLGARWLHWANGVCFAALLSFRRKDRDGSASLAVTPRQSSGQARRTAAQGHRQTGPLGLNCV